MLYAQFVFSFPPSFIVERERKESSSDWVSCTLHSKFPHRSSYYICSQISLQSTFYASIHIHEQIINSCKVQGENKSTSRRTKEKNRGKIAWMKAATYVTILPCSLFFIFFLFLVFLFRRLLFTFLSENNSRSFVNSRAWS
jgi:hypothetical protein